GFRHGSVKDLRVVAGDEQGLVTAAVKQPPELLIAHAGEERRVRDLPAVEVQDGKHGAVARGVQELRRVPARGERAGLRLAIPHPAGGDERGVVEYGAKGM